MFLNFTQNPASHRTGQTYMFMNHQIGPLYWHRSYTVVSKMCSIQNFRLTESEKKNMMEQIFIEIGKKKYQQ